MVPGSEPTIGIKRKRLSLLKLACSVLRKKVMNANKRCSLHPGIVLPSSEPIGGMLALTQVRSGLTYNFI
jgi:hypothetical protein